MLVEDLGGGQQSVHDWHLHVHGRDIRPVGLIVRDCRSAIGSLIDHLMARVSQQPAEQSTRNYGIVDDHDSRHYHPLTTLYSQEAAEPRPFRKRYCDSAAEPFDTLQANSEAKELSHEVSRVLEASTKLIGQRRSPLEPNARSPLVWNRPPRIPRAH